MKETDQTTGNAGEKNSQQDQPAENGKKAIEAEKKVNKNNKPAKLQNDEEAKDAEAWRNEG